EPRLRVDPRRLADRQLGAFDVAAEPLVRETVHRRVEVRMVADQVAGLGDAPRDVGIRARPAALEEERAADSLAGERLEGPVLAARPGGPAGGLGVARERDPRHWASVTLVRPVGAAESSPFASASAPAKSWPGTSESSGARSGDGAAGTGRRYAAPSISDCAFPLATSIAPASRALRAASTIVGSASSLEAIVQTGKRGS